MYVAAGRAVSQGTDPYLVRVLAEGRPFTYPPLVAWTFQPLSEVPFAAVVVGQAVISGLAILALAVGLARSLGLRSPRSRAVLLAAVLAEPVYTAVMVGQVDPVVMAVVVTDLVFIPRRHRGWLLGLAIAVKLTPAIFLLILILDRDRRAIARAASIFVASVAWGFVCLPGPSTRYWGGAFNDLGRFEYDAGPRLDNQSARAAILRVIHQSTMSGHWTTLVVILCVVLGAWVATMAYRRGNRWEALAALAVGGMLASPVTWTTQWSWGVALVSILWFSGRRGTATVTVVVLSVEPMLWLGNYYHHLSELHLPWRLQPIASAYGVLGLALLAILSRPGPKDREPVRQG